MSRVFSRCWLVPTVVTIGALGLASSPALGAAPSSARVQIPGTHPSWAVATPPASAPAVNSGTISARVYLAGQAPEGLTEYATAVSTPGNPKYGNYLSAEQAQADFGPTGTQIAAVESWLKESGLSLIHI